MAVDLPSMVKMDEPQKKSILDSSIRSPIGSTELRVWIDCKLETDPLVISFSVAVHDCAVGLRNVSDPEPFLLLISISVMSLKREYHQLS
jgi:hypothetical protein